MGVQISCGKGTSEAGHVRPFATDVARSVVCVSVCRLCSRVSCAKTAEQIKMPFGLG